MRPTGVTSYYWQNTLRPAILERDGHRCRICGDHRKLEIDHIIPRLRGGTDHPSNLQTLCQYHNRKKGANTPPTRQWA